MKKGRALASIVALVMLLYLIAGCENEKIKIKFDEYEQSGGKLQDVRRLAVLPFRGDSYGSGGDMSLSLANHLRLLGYIEMIDPEESRQILAEKGISANVEPNSAELLKAAQALNVDGLLYGKMDARFYSEVRYRNEDFYYPGYPSYSGFSIFIGRPRGFHYYGRRFPVPSLRRQGSVRMEIQLFDARLSKDIGTIDLSKSYFHEYDYDEFDYYGTSPHGPFWFDRLKRVQMPSNQEMMLIIADRLLDSMIAQFIPYYVSRIRSIQQDAPGADLALSGKWDDARDIWERTRIGPEVDWKTYTNLGIYYERKANPSEALYYYKKALELQPSSELLKEYARQAESAAQSMKPLVPVDLTLSVIEYKIAEIKKDGRIYINAGEEKGIKPGDEFVVVRYHVDFDSDLVSARGGYYYRVCNVTIEKVFQGVSQGRSSDASASFAPRSGDPAARLTKNTPAR